MKGRGILRIAVLALAAIEAALGIALLAIFLQPASDPMGAEIGQGMAMLTAIPLALGTLPALLLAWHGRWLWPALILALAAPPAFFLLWAHA
ncbi:MAG TPA: hypothetical protein VMT54_21515 [Candidatus Cybelea sp.]|nr:hypothetical protein [Candidatus Cybelea sp.]